MKRQPANTTEMEQNACTIDLMALRGGSSGHYANNERCNESVDLVPEEAVEEGC